MIQSDLKSIVALLKSMAQLELTVSRFYTVCAQVMDDEKVFWLGISGQEENHAKSLYRMYIILIARPERFEKDRVFNTTAISTFISGVTAHIERVQKGDLPKKSVLILARDIENSLLENKISEIVKTDDVEYQSLAKSIVSETDNHKGVIQEKIRQLEKSGG